MATATDKAHHKPDVHLRHALATLVYRAAKALRDTPPEFSAFRPGKDSRSAGEILSHLCDLMDWALTQARGEERWRNSHSNAWNADCDRFFASATALDQYLAPGDALKVPAETLFQGAIADSLTHVGQIAMLRRLAGAPVRGENYSKAKIEAGRTGSDQNRPAREFD